MDLLLKFFVPPGLGGSLRAAAALSAAEPHAAAPGSCWWEDLLLRVC